MKINILGTDYEIVEQTQEENPKLDDAHGLCEVLSKRIILDKDMTKPSKQTLEKLEIYKNKVLRHEIIHALFFESGLHSNSDYADNEELVDWIAIQFPKMKKLFEELNIEK